MGAGCVRNVCVKSGKANFKKTFLCWRNVQHCGWRFFSCHMFSWTYIGICISCTHLSPPRLSNNNYKDKSSMLTIGEGELSFRLPRSPGYEWDIKTVRTRIRGHFRKPLKASYRTIRWKTVLGCVYIPKGNNLKIWKCPYLKKICVSA